MFLDRGHVGQAITALAELTDEELTVLLPTHGFSLNSIDLIRNNDRAGLIEGRQRSLIEGEREFMKTRDIAPPTRQMAVSIADSDGSDDDYAE